MHLAFSEDKKDQGRIAVGRNGVKHSDSLQTKGESRGFFAALLQSLKVVPRRKKENQSSLTPLISLQSVCLHREALFEFPYVLFQFVKFNDYCGMLFTPHNHFVEAT